MAIRSFAYRWPGAITVALQILAGIDLVASLASLVFAAASLAALGHMGLQAQNLAIGGTGLILLLQILLRLATHILRALWTHRLVCNAGLFQTLPVSPFWAWAGFFVPVASVWFPASLMLALSCTGPRQSRVLNPVCLVWAIARWLSSPSGAVMSLVVLVAQVTYGELIEHHPAKSAPLVLMMMLVLAVAGIVSAALSLVLVAWIGRRQPKPGQLHHAEIFA